MSAAIGGIIASAFTELVTLVIHKATGKHPDDDETLKALVERVVRDAMQSGLTELEDRMSHELAALGIVGSLYDLDIILRGVDDWFKPRGELPDILGGASITQMPPDWKPDPEG